MCMATQTKDVQEGCGSIVGQVPSLTMVHRLVPKRILHLGEPSLARPLITY